MDRLRGLTSGALTRVLSGGHRRTRVSRQVRKTKASPQLPKESDDGCSPCKCEACRSEASAPSTGASSHKGLPVSWALTTVRISSALFLSTAGHRWLLGLVVLPWGSSLVPTRACKRWRFPGLTPSNSSSSVDLVKIY